MPLRMRAFKAVRFGSTRRRCFQRMSSRRRSSPLGRSFDGRCSSRVRFDEQYGGNAWREETAFFIEAVRHGFVCMLTGVTFSYQIEQWKGGARRPRLRYEYWVMRNNGRFLRMHGRWLASHGHLRHPVLEQLAFMGGRLRTLAHGYLAARRTS